jgi:hypothetical protein
MPASNQSRKLKEQDEAVMAAFGTQKRIISIDTPPNKITPSMEWACPSQTGGSIYRIFAGKWTTHHDFLRTFVNALGPLPSCQTFAFEMTQ